MERLSDHGFKQLDNDRIALICIHAAKTSYMALLRAAHRIRSSIRRTDYVLLSGPSCVIVLPETSFEGAQIVAKRCYPLLADTEYELQIVSGIAAQLRVHQLYEDQALMVVNSADHAPVGLKSQLSYEVDKPGAAPYLAFLEGYPTHEVLHLFPYTLACRYRCVPVGADRGVLTLATCQCLEQDILSQFQEVTRREIFQVRCEAGMIDDVLAYWQSIVST